MSYFRKVLIFFLILSITGCGNLNSIYRPLNTNNGSGALIDIKQRAILTARVGNKTVICAEPSPDTLSSYLADLSANKGDVGISSKFKENAAFIGLRTQSIQLLRDSYFRLCEAYMNGAIDRDDYDTILRRYQQNTIALLAIESLTGTVKSPQASLLQSNLSGELSILSSSIQKTKQKISNADNDKDVQSYQQELQKTEKNYSNVLQILANQNNNVSTPVKTMNGSIATVVKDLTSEVLSTDYYGQLCWSLLTNKTKGNSKIRNTCINFFKLKNKDINSNIDNITELMNQVRQYKKQTKPELASSNKEIEELELKIVALKKALEQSTKVFQINPPQN